MKPVAKDYGVRVIKPFGQFDVGFVMTPSAMYREQLLRRGLVEPVPPPDDEPKRGLRQKTLGLTR